MSSGLSDVERDHNLTIQPGSRREHEGFDGVAAGRGPGGAHEHRGGPGGAHEHRGGPGGVHERRGGRAGEHEHRPGAGAGGPGGGPRWDLFYLQLSRGFGRRISGSWRLGAIDDLDWGVDVTQGGQFEQLKPGHSRRPPLTSPGLLSGVEEADHGFPGENHRLSRKDHWLPWSLDLWRGGTWGATELKLGGSQGGERVAGGSDGGGWWRCGSPHWRRPQARERVGAGSGCGSSRCGSSRGASCSCGWSRGYLKSATGGSGNSHSTSSGFLSHKIGQKLLLVVLEVEPEAGRLVSAAEPGEGEGDFVARDPGDDTPLLLIQINDQ